MYSVPHVTPRTRRKPKKKMEGEEIKPLHFLRNIKGILTKAKRLRADRVASESSATSLEKNQNIAKLKDAPKDQTAASDISGVQLDPGPTSTTQSTSSPLLTEKASKKCTQDSRTSPSPAQTVFDSTTPAEKVATSLQPSSGAEPRDQSSPTKPPAPPNNWLECKVCAINVSGPKNMQMHVAGKAHLKKLRLQQKKAKPPRIIDEEMRQPAGSQDAGHWTSPPDQTAAASSTPTTDNMSSALASSTPTTDNMSSALGLKEVTSVTASADPLILSAPRPVSFSHSHPRPQLAALQNTAIGKSQDLAPVSAASRLVLQAPGAAPKAGDACNSSSYSHGQSEYGPTDFLSFAAKPADRQLSLQSLSGGTEALPVQPRHTQQGLDKLQGKTKGGMWPQTKKKRRRPSSEAGPDGSETRVVPAAQTESSAVAATAAAAAVAAAAADELTRASLYSAPWVGAASGNSGHALASSSSSSSSSASSSASASSLPVHDPYKGFHNIGLRLHEEILDYCAYVKPSSHEHVDRLDLLRRIREVVHSIWPQRRRHTATESSSKDPPGGEYVVNVRPFGSFATDTYLPSSDMDLVVFGASEADEMEAAGEGESPSNSEEGNDRLPPRRRRRLNPLQRLANALRQTDMVSYLEVVDRARVPIVKFTDKKSGIDCDICFDRVSGLQSVVLVRRMLQEQPAMRPLVLVVKQILQNRRLNDTYTGTD